MSNVPEYSESKQDPRKWLDYNTATKSYTNSRQFFLGLDVEVLAHDSIFSIVVNNSKKKAPYRTALYEEFREITAITPIPDNSKLTTLENEYDESLKYEKNSMNRVVNPSNRISRKSSLVQKEYEMETIKYNNELARHTKLVESKRTANAHNKLIREGMRDLTRYLKSTITESAMRKLNFSSQQIQLLIDGYEYFLLKEALSTALDESDSILCFRSENILNEFTNAVKSTSQSSANSTTAEIIKDLHEKIVRVIKLYESMTNQRNHEDSSSTAASSSQTIPTLLSNSINLSFIEANEGSINHPKTNKYIESLIHIVYRSLPKESQTIDTWDNQVENRSQPKDIFNFCQILDRSQSRASSEVNLNRDPTDKFKASAARPGTKQTGDNIDRSSDYERSDEYNSNKTHGKRKHEENKVERDFTAKETSEYNRRKARHKAKSGNRPNKNTNNNNSTQFARSSDKNDDKKI